jgi:hypothetical protein
MKIVDRKTVIHNMGETRTVQNFNQVLGDKPHKLGLVATLYPDLAINVLTDALKNIFYNKERGTESFQPINAMAVEWTIDVNYIPKVMIVADVAGATPGLNKQPITMYLEKKYFDKGDTFALENQQQAFVIAPPRQVTAGKWEHIVVLAGNDYSKSFDPRYLKKGKQTRYRSNFHPELSERGYTKYTSNTEQHRNWMSRHRASETVSADYKMREAVYLEIAKKDKKEYFKMHQHEVDCLNTFTEAKNNACIFSVTNYDANGKCLDQDEAGRDVPMSDGVLPQIERYCDKFLYNALSSEVLDDVLAAMVEKSAKPTGNIYTVISNERFYTQFGRIMKQDYRFNAPNDASFLYSKEKGKVQVGAEFSSYTIQGNTIVFMPDRSLSQEFAEYGYAVFLDTSADIKTGRPGLASFTLEGSEMVDGFVNGLGGRSGSASGQDIATGVHGSEYHIIGYSCAVLFNPYKSFILKENVYLD